jgi:hypothetical protein
MATTLSSSRICISGSPLGAKVFFQAAGMGWPKV